MTRNHGLFNASELKPTGGLSGVLCPSHVESLPVILLLPVLWSEKKELSIMRKRVLYYILLSIKSLVTVISLESK